MPQTHLLSKRNKDEQKFKIKLTDMNANIYSINFHHGDFEMEEYALLQGIKTIGQSL